MSKTLEIERKRKIAVLKYELSKLKREASKLQLEAKLRRELLQRLSMEENGGSLSHSEMISNRGLKQGSRGSNSINKLSLDYVEDSAIEYGGKGWISVSLRDDKQQRIEARMEKLQLHQQAKLGLCRRLCIEVWESKLEREASKLQLEAKLRHKLLQRLSMEEKRGSLCHSEMIRQQRIEARMERLQHHQQAKLGLYRRIWYADLPQTNT
ncbi:hypothetical protein FCV25MIE_21329 [Fagus crenata]